MNRRDLIIGGACLSALGASEALRPRTHVSLKGKAELADIIPRRFGGWISEEGGDIVMPRTEGSLSARLYNDTIARVYSPIRDEMLPHMMLLVAYGESQTDGLQLHRPESCYPAVGFDIRYRKPMMLPLGRDAMLPATELTAQAGDRTEDIIYWTRLGEYLPRTAGEQRSDRLMTAMRGIISDGILVRASLVRPATEPRFQDLYKFVASLLDAVSPLERKTLVGTSLNRQLGSSLNVKF